MLRKNLKHLTKARILLALILAATLTFGATGVVFATLSGSTFQSGDGNLIVDNQSSGTHDWNAPVEPIVCPPGGLGAGTNCGLDWVNSGSDNAFGQGTKEDDVNPVVVTGSIPPKKDDLTRFYVNQERANGKDFLYLAWERTNLLGSAHLDFELNQGSQINPTNNTTIVRTAGDILIDFDFGGSGIPVLALHRWITTGSAADCEASSTLPCWDKASLHSLAAFYEAAVNSAPVTDTNPPNAPLTLDGNTKNGINSTFGEAGINLTDAGIFSQTVCQHFGFASLKSRSSGQSFTSEMKDFIAPIPVNISNCGNIIIRKVTNPSPDPTGTTFAYTTTGGLTPATFSLKDGEKQDYQNKVLAGSYTVTETDPGTNFTLSNLACTATGSGTSYSKSGAVVSITLAPEGLVDCTYTNKLQQGAVKVTKTSVKGNTALQGAKFSVTGPSGTFTLTTGSDGTACVDKLQFGDYTVKETAAPTGYNIDDTTSHTVTVNSNATCSDNPYSGGGVSFSDTPLSQIEVKFSSLAGAGVTKASIVCQLNSADVAAVTENGSADPALDDTDEVFTNLTPGTYTCTVVVDP